MIDVYPPMHITTKHHISCLYLLQLFGVFKCMSVAVWFIDIFSDLNYTCINFIQSSYLRLLSVAFHLLYHNNTVLS